jgi:hypothetical protein
LVWDAERQYNHVQQAVTTTTAKLYEALATQPKGFSLFVGLAIDNIANTVTNTMNVAKNSVMFYCLFIYC